MSKRNQTPAPTAALTVEEAGDYLRISRSSLYRLIRDGRLRPARIGRRVVFRRIDIDAFLSTCLDSSSAA